MVRSLGRVARRVAGSNVDATGGLLIGIAALANPGEPSCSLNKAHEPSRPHNDRPVGVEGVYPHANTIYFFFLYTYMEGGTTWGGGHVMRQ